MDLEFVPAPRTSRAEVFLVAPAPRRSFYAVQKAGKSPTRCRGYDDPRRRAFPGLHS